MVETRLYLYDSSQADYKGTNYSANILTGNIWTDDLTEVLDVAEITLVGLDRSEEFDPTTKFIMELYDTQSQMVVETLSLCVAEDLVSQPILSDDNYFNHAITFNEASVVAQGRIVDNCSETFELKNVNINDESVYDPNKKADGIKNNTTDQDFVAQFLSGGIPLLSYHENITYKRKFEWVFTEEYLPNTDANYGQASAWNNIPMYKAVSGTDTIQLPIPLLATYFGAKGTSGYETHKNFCSVSVEVYESDDGSSWTMMAGYPLNINPSKQISQENDWVCDWRFQERYGSEVKGYGMTKTSASRGAMQEYYKKFAEFDDTTASRFINISVVANKQYMVIVKPKFFATPLKELGNHEISHLGLTNYLYGDSDSIYYTHTYSYSRASVSFTLGYDYEINNSSSQIVLPTTASNTGSPMMKLQFSTYVAGSNVSTFLKSAPSLSAYDLFTDALLKTQTTFKKEGVYIKDTPLAYYCDPADINKLQATEIIESSFNQKNFWEILLEVGKYIHAIPYIEFGENDRFNVKWRYLGKTDKTDGVSTTMSIFNSRSIENYVGAINSYVDNMVQKGGQVDEWVSPKTESDDYLVYNDTAVIKTTKPIIEILSLKFRIMHSNGIYYTASSTEYDITENIYEHNIYELLDVSAAIVPNKGLGIYYNLGDNVIRGLNYQLPSVNTGDGETEYAIKRIIGSLIMANDENNWKNIKINDFAFHITYRTKETIRSEQSRPDLRKYLINSAYEKIPHHTQFNNQQDKMVDSVKMGNQVYGKLIRTGNTEYQTTEWCNNAWELKKSGDLVDIRGNIYYVSKATHTFFQDHIISEITYSKDYNQLSEIIGIPSEPRFFEISEQNSVDRQVLINDYIYLGTTYNGVEQARFFGENGFDYFSKLLFNNKAYPKYALTQFKNDNDNPDATQGLALFSKAFMHPLSSYSMRNTLSLKWEMVDNFSAGDRVEDKGTYKDSSSAQTRIDTAYATLLPSQYCDMYGRADLIDFGIITDIPNALKTKENIQDLPLSPVRFLPNMELKWNYGENEVGKYYTSLTYKYDTNDQTATNITSSTTRFTLKSNGFDNYGDIYSNGVSIINHLDARVNNGDYFILLDNGLYCLFAKMLDYEIDDIVFERCFISNNIADVLAEVQKPSMIELSYYYGNDNLVVSSGADGYINYEEDINYESTDFGTHQHGLALVKDNRERIIFDYNLQMLTDSDRFVLSGYLWQQNKGSVKLALLNQEVNKIINNTIPEDSIIKDNSTDLPKLYTFNISTIMCYYSYINIGNATRLDQNNNTINLRDEIDDNVKAIAIVLEKKPSVSAGNERYFVVARNVDGLTNAQKDDTWYISPPSTEDFFKKQ